MVGHVAVSVVAPGRPPRVPHDEMAGILEIPDDQHRMAAKTLVEARGHRHDPRPLDEPALEGVVDVEPERERPVIRQTGAHVGQVPFNPHVANGLVLGRSRAAPEGGPSPKPSHVVGPQAFRADAVARDGLVPGAQGDRAVVREDAFDRPLVEVDEQTGWANGRGTGAVATVSEPQCRSNRIRRTGIEMALVVDRRHVWTEVHHLGQLPLEAGRRLVMVVTPVVAVLGGTVAESGQSWRHLPGPSYGFGRR